MESRQTVHVGFLRFFRSLALPEVAVSSAMVRFGFTQNTTVCFRYYAHLQIRNLRKTRLVANDDDDGVFYK